MQSGAAFVGFALTVVVASNLAQAVVGRIGVRATLTAGLLIAALSVALLTRLPVDGHYFWDLFPAFVLGGAGMGFSFVPVTIASLTGVERAHAGVASGLINTSRQIGGAIGIASISAIAAASTTSYVHSHPGLEGSNVVALNHGFQAGLYVLAGLLVLGALIAATLVRSVPAPSESGACRRRAGCSRRGRLTNDDSKEPTMSKPQTACTRPSASSTQSRSIRSRRFLRRFSRAIQRTSASSLSSKRSKSGMPSSGRATIATLQA